VLTLVSLPVFAMILARIENREEDGDIDFA
jgi:hypothetical protein